MKIKTFITGPIDVNTYLVINQKNEAFLVDPSGYDDIVSYIDDKNVNLKFILLTHGHYDHIYKLDEITDKYQCPVYIHEGDSDCIKDPSKNLSSYANEYVSFDIKPNKLTEGEHTIDNFKINVIHTPGHTPGSAIYYLKQQRIAFTGDFLFKGTIGRTDLPLGDMRKMQKSIEKIKMLSKDTIIYPGHGPKSNIKSELKLNPYLNKMDF